LRRVQKPNPAKPNRKRRCVHLTQPSKPDPTLSSLNRLRNKSDFFTPNWSLEVSSGVPLWLTIKITGFSATPPFSGTVLSKLSPGVVPITAVYHFTQLGALQPYLGGGIVPSFELAVQDGFNTGGSFAPTVGLVAQAGSDYMFNRNWGVFLDVKKLFIWSTGKSTGFDLGPPIGTIPGAATIKTTFQPWLFSTGVTYRF
jgi:outer membrane protein